MDFCAIASQQALDTISRHCPQALSTYLMLLPRANSDGEVFLSKIEIDKDLSEEWHKFRRSIKSLAREGYLEWHEINNGIKIILAKL